MGMGKESFGGVGGRVRNIPESPLYVYFPRSSPWVIFRFALGMIWLRVYVPPESCLQVLQWLFHLVSKASIYNARRGQRTRGCVTAGPAQASQSTWCCRNGTFPGSLS